MDTVTSVYFLVGAAVVLVFSVNYFNQPGYKFADEQKNVLDDQEDLMLEPALPKYMTDRFVYNLYLFTYVLVSELFYVLLVLFLPDIIKVDAVNQAVPLAPTRQNVVLACLIITGIAPNLPYIRQLLERSKFFLHEKAQIPKKGREVYHKIKNSTPHYRKGEIVEILGDERFARNDTHAEKVRPDLVAADFDMGWWTMEGRWAKLSYLLCCVKRWSEMYPFRGSIGNHELRYSSIDGAYEELQRLMCQYKEGALAEAKSSRLNARLDATLHRTYRLISCLLYLAGKSDSAVDNYLDELGYVATERNDFPVPWKNMVFVITAIAGSIMTGGLLALVITQLGLVPFAATIKTTNIFFWIMYAVPVLAIPVLMVLLIKSYLASHSDVWPIVTEKERYRRLGDRPWQIYAVVSLVAYLTGGCVLFATSVAFKIMRQKELAPLGAMLQSAFVWSVIVLVTAGFAAFRLDSAPDSERPPRERLALRCGGALLQGVATMFVVFLAFVHTFNNGDLNVVSLAEPARGKLMVYCLISFFLGASIHAASSFGKIRQRRSEGRRRVSRTVLIRAGEKELAGRTVNVSRYGALIESQEDMPEEETAIAIAAKTGMSSSALIAGRRGNYLHLHFADNVSWLEVQSALGIPAAA